MDNSKSNFDPYAAPSVSDFSLQNESDDLSPGERRLLKDFRSQSLSLGVLWLLFATVLSLVALSALFGPSLNSVNRIAGFILALLATIFATGGAGTLMKNPWGIYVGLTAAYISLIGSVLQSNACGFVLIIVVLIQGHRILKLMKELNQAGIPFNTKPTVIRSSSSN